MTSQRRFQVGVQLIPIQTTLASLRRAWCSLDELGVDGIWLPDHLLSRELEPHHECWSLLAAMAGDTARARIGSLVSCNVFRNPELLAHVAFTVAGLSGGRVTLGVGAGWFEQEFVEYGFDGLTMPGRMRRLARDLPRIRARLVTLSGGSGDRVPLLVGGNGEQVCLRLAARHADVCNVRCDPDAFNRKMRLLDRYCRDAGRDPGALERTVLVKESDLGQIGRYVAGGAAQVVLTWLPPFSLDPVRRLLALAT